MPSLGGQGEVAAVYPDGRNLVVAAAPFVVRIITM